MKVTGPDLEETAAGNVVLFNFYAAAGVTISTSSGKLKKRNGIKRIRNRKLRIIAEVQTGLHLPLIDIKTFMKANGLLAEAPTVGIAKTRRIEELPLNIFAKDEISNCQFTGYIKKGDWYYKTRNKTGEIQSLPISSGSPNDLKS